ncbi:MAG: RHS repeat-associated core domain-containing protein [Firmicutes bacterium]|nr:RHS repeat-associated core domain-containing protein [Bacillota bacterium]
METGILLLTHRYLDPATGRFLTRDPAGCEASVNVYAYVGNNAVNEVDPSGLWYFPPRIGPVLPPGLFDVTRCIACALRGLQKGYEVLEHTANDKLAHCVATCEITRCSGSETCAHLSGVCREVLQDTLYRASFGYFGSRIDPHDIFANAHGINCANSKKSCIACCISKITRSVL